jgi:hypothetical protein
MKISRIVDLHADAGSPRRAKLIAARSSQDLALLTRDWQCALEICFPFGKRPLRRNECDFTRDAIDHRNSRGKLSVLAIPTWPHVHAILGIICLLPGDFPGEQTSAPECWSSVTIRPLPCSRRSAGRLVRRRKARRRAPY